MTHPLLAPAMIQRGERSALASAALKYIPRIVSISAVDLFERYSVSLVFKFDELRIYNGRK